MKEWIKISLTVLITFALTCAIISPDKDEPTEDFILDSNNSDADGTSEDEQPDYNFITCHYCDDRVPDVFVYIDNGDPVCPDCVYSALRDVISDDTGKCYNCGEFYDLDWSFGLGLCHDCGYSTITDCVFCGDPTFVWADDDWYAFCPRCMAYAVENTDIVELLEEMRE